MNVLFNPLRTLRSLAVVALVAGCAAIALGQPSPKSDDKKADPKAETKTDEQLARESFFTNKWDAKSLEKLKKAVEEKPELGSAEVVMARWMFEAQKGREARQLLESAAAQIPNHPAVYITNAMFAFNEGRVTDAIMSLRQAQAAVDNGTWSKAQKNEFLPDIYLGLASAFERRGAWYDAQQMLSKLNEIKPDNPQTLTRLARASFILNNDSQAEEYLQKAYNKDKALDLPELVMAQMWAQKAVVVDPADPKFKQKVKEETDKNRAKAQEWYTRALTKYDPAKALTSTNADDKEKAAKACRAYAIYLVEKGDKEAAKNQLDTARKLDPDSRETKTAIGIYDRYTGNLKDAATNLQAALVQSPSYGPALVNLALSLIDQNSSPNPVNKTEQDRALGYAQLFQNSNPQNPEGFAVVGYCQMKKGDLDAADKTLAQALNQAQQSGGLTPDAGYFVAAFQMEKKKYKDAKDILEKVVTPEKNFIYKPQAETLLEKAKEEVKKETPTSTPAPKP